MYIDITRSWSEIVSRAITVVLLTVSTSACLAPATEQSPDPVVQDFAIAYVKRPITESEDLRQRLGFIEGGDLYLRDLASPSAAESNITLIETEGLGDVRDVESSFDGDRLLFSLRKPDIEGADPEDQPTWNIWEYEIDSGILQRIIADDLTAEGGQDLAPHYLPDGRIIFSSTRQQQAKPGSRYFCESLFWASKPKQTAKLHATVYACGAPTVLRTLRNHLFAALHNSLSDSTPT
ncbi:hypothetical protein [Candidatus Reidiella endopervernicosa]|uniref:PD40 domain-containing protein n=1 Tax=Candidatus Reidiella endopervernicosa TaxID=2738883 RepID=A0A6N0HWM9_9GAMM|nr:hypothetical protein [Candidatus Reidiella endopervernicosa]QKQ26779.1 hypothetical protein HUE57_11145 [Candidatus Reidiella endopervernicosa]